MYFSDIYADRRLPDHVRNDETLWGECLAGALYWNDFNRLVRSCGFQDPRLVSDQVVTINNRTLQRLVQNVSFYSATYRLWKLEGLEPDCEDYGQAVMYLGSPEWESSDHLDLDGHHRFFKNKIMPVCGNTFLMLKNTRYASCFQFYGDFRQHFGIFPDCGKTIPFHKNADESQSKKSCC